MMSSSSSPFSALTILLAVLVALATLTSGAHGMELSVEELKEIFVQYDVDIERTPKCQSLEIEAIICPTDAVTLKCEDTETIQKHCQSLLNLSEDEASEWLKADIEQGTNAYYGCIVYTAEHIFEPENYVGCCNRSHCEDWTDMFSMGEHDDDDDDHFDDDFDMNIRDPEPEPEQADEL